MPAGQCKTPYNLDHTAISAEDASPTRVPKCILRHSSCREHCSCVLAWPRAPLVHRRAMAARGAQLPFQHPRYELVCPQLHDVHRAHQPPQISLLGSGASSTVYLARDTSGTQWAIKLIKRGFGQGPDGAKVRLFLKKPV